MYCCAASQSLYPNGELKDFVPAMLDLKHDGEKLNGEGADDVRAISRNEKWSDELEADEVTNIPMVLQHDDGKPCRKP